MSLIPSSESNHLAKSMPAGSGEVRVLLRPQVRGTAATGYTRSDPRFQSLGTLRRHWIAILAFTVICTAATYFISMRLTPVYEATTTIDVDRQAAPGIIGQDAKRPDADTDYDQFLATQVRLIQSDSVIRPVARRFGLAQKEGQVQTTLAHENAPVVLKNLSVTRPANTFLLEVSYRSSDPQLAADAANAISNSYIEHMFESRVEASAKLSSFMDKQLDTLKNKMDNSGIALTQFERDMNLINPEEKTNMLSARLMQVNTEYTNAQTDRVRKQAAYDSAKTGTLETAIISTQGDVLKRILQKQDEAEERFVQVKEHYGAGHPEYQKAAAQIQELQRQAEATRTSLIKRSQAEYDEAIARESMLQQAVTEIRGEFNQLNSRSFEYQQRKREAEGDKKLYEELIRRIREANINANFDSNAIRLADLARPPAEPMLPRVKRNTFFAFLLSSLLACGIALLGERMNTTVRYADQVSHSLGTNVVGILPVVREWRSKGAALPEGPASKQVTKSSLSVFAFEESIRTLRNSILLGTRDRPIRSILVTSAATGEGKSTTALHLAFAHAAHGLKTLLIDGDLRRPTLHTLLGTGSKFGLADALVSDRSVALALGPVAQRPYLDFMGAGEPSRLASDLLGQRIGEILECMMPEYDLIVLDGPPFLGIAESLRLASSVDAVVVVTRVGQTSQEALELVLHNLFQLRANVAGVVLNHASAGLGDIYGTYR